jgi:predicted CXXCH cytochrome family protein
MRAVYYIVLLVAGGVLSACNDEPGVVAPTAEPTYLNLNSDVSYVGKEACQPCHTTQYETFIQSQMGRSFKAATLSNSAASFDDPAPVYDPFNDFYYRPFTKGNALFIMEYRLSGRDTVFKRIEQIDYIVGSGQHTNSHIMEENGYLYQMPLTWYAQDGKWGLPPKFGRDNNSRFSRPIPLRCMTCHNAMPDFIQGSENRYANVPHGIDCERCHGPGSLHVREKQAGKVVDVNSEIDYTIVNPRKLPVDLQFNVCQRCHMQGAAVFKEGKTAFDFRPGMRLEDVENVFWPRYPDSVEHFIMASHPDRLQMSSCYLQSHEEGRDYAPMTCITCHNPHLSIETLSKEHYTQVCQSCHTAARDNLCTEDKAVRASRADHFIRVVSSDDSSRLSPEAVTAQKEFIRLAGLIDDAPTDREIADGFLTYYEEITDTPAFLDSAAVYLEKARQNVSPQALAPSWIRLWFWQEKYEDVISLAQTLDEQTLRNPWTLYRIGEAFMQTGRTREAIHYYTLAVNLAPLHLRFLNKLASAYSEDGQLHQAISIFDTILEANPKFDQAYNNRGFTRVMLGDLQGAEVDFLAALALNPDAPLSLGNIASLYYNTNRKAEARPYVQRLLELEPDNPRYRQLWNLLQ